MIRVNKSVYLKVPLLEELRFTEELLQCEKTMSFNKEWGGIVAFPKEKWQSFFDGYSQNSNRHYFHIYNLDNIFIGEISSRFSNEFESYILNIKIKYEYRGNNHANDALDLFLDYMFEEVKTDKIRDNVGLKSKAGIRLLKSFGFLEVYKTSEFIMLELKRENYM